MMISRVNDRELFNIPKVELHCHLELAYRPSTMKSWAIEDGDLPEGCSDEEFKAKYMVLSPMNDLPTVLQKFLVTRDRIKSLERIERLAFEACEDMHLISNVRILELRYAPSFVLEVYPELGADKMHEAIMKGCARAETQYPMAIGLICLLQRIKPVSENEYWTDFAIERKGEILGLDLADDEVNYPPDVFAHLFLKAKSQGLGITVHAGEPSVPQAPGNILTSIEKLGADRIGHGVQAIHDPNVIDVLRETCVPLELCPTSNVLTKAVENLKDHPLKKLMELGVRTTINSDDPGVMGITLMTEYDKSYNALGMSLKQLEQCNQWAAEASFICKEKKEKVWSF
jgi:adenosine deaminase